VKNHFFRPYFFRETPLRAHKTLLNLTVKYVTENTELLLSCFPELQKSSLVGGAVGHTVFTVCTHEERIDMRKYLRSTILATLSLAFVGTAFAVEYNRVPAGDGQYRECLVYAARLYEGGDARSPVPGQTKAQAWCTCLWNETPDDFKGNLVTFSESAKGQRINKLCEKYADWAD
jgi:hypothetical protein